VEAKVEELTQRGLTLQAEADRLREAQKAGEAEVDSHPLHFPSSFLLPCSLHSLPSITSSRMLSTLSSAHTVYSPLSDHPYKRSFPLSDCLGGRRTEGLV
jgi:hypothetical protein